MGKSTVARYLAAAGECVIDTDDLARELVAPGEPALEEIRAELSDLTGRLLVSQQIGQEGTIDVTAFHQGVYFLRLVSRGEILTRKIVIE